MNELELSKLKILLKEYNKTTNKNKIKLSIEILIESIEKKLKLIRWN